VSLIAQCMQRRSLGLENVRDDWRLHALMRGIGVHHNDISSGLRNTVEVMFRKKQLCIVFAISTLAQGIHMPCPTVVFFGDSEELNATTYRQMSGRAGRRGFDKRGNVVFAGLPRHKIERLLNSKLPPLIGTTPIDSNMLLRTLVLHDVDAVRDKDRGSEWIEESKEEAVEGTKRLLTVRPAVFVAAAISERCMETCVWCWGRCNSCRSCHGSTRRPRRCRSSK
jgi:superfamily II RNA helicase